MEINKTLKENRLVLKLNGRLDTKTAPELDKVLKNDISGVKDLVLDFEELEYISSAGLRSILWAQKNMDKEGTLKIKNVNNLIMEIFEATGFVNILTIE